MVDGYRAHPVFARWYIRGSEAMDRSGGAELRTELLAGLSGTVIEVGAGNGRNFGYYPPAVTSVLAVEPEPTLRAAARKAAAQSAIPIQVIDGMADSLPAEDAAFDTGVASLMLCSVPDQAVALVEFHRVIRAQGQLRFYEHVRSEHPGLLRRVQHLIDATFWPPIAAGCHASRDTPSAITAAGFEIERLRRFRLPEKGIILPVSPHVIGSARRR